MDDVMLHKSILMLHIATGTLGMLSGFVAVFLRKGSRRHAIAGNVFVASMILLSASGMFLAARKSDPGNFLGGAVTFYLVTTAWWTARRREGTSAWDWAGLAIILTLAATELTLGTLAALSPTGMMYRYTPGPYFFLGTVAILATVGDIRMLVRHGIEGNKRLARHLWRMCFALFIAALSIFLARQQVFPAILRRTGVLMFLGFLPLGLMFFWLVRVRWLARRRYPLAAHALSPIHLAKTGA